MQGDVNYRNIYIVALNCYVADTNDDGGNNNNNDDDAFVTLVANEHKFDLTQSVHEGLLLHASAPFVCVHCILGSVVCMHVVASMVNDKLRILFYLN